MKYWICFLIIVVIYSKTNAQEFSTEFTNNTTLHKNNYAVLSNTNKHWFILTEVDPSNNFRQTISALSIGNNGNIQFSNSYETSDNSISLNTQQALALPNGDVIVAGTYKPNTSPLSSPYFMSLDSSGNINWVKQMNISNASGIFFLKQLSDSSILVNARNNDGAIHQLLFKVDLLGNFSDFHEHNLSTANVKDVLVNTNSFDLLLFDGNLINIDNDLQTINWQRKYDHIIGITINKAANGDYLLATAQVAFPGHMTVTRLDALGAIIWTKYIETFEPIAGFEFDIVGFHFISENSNGDIIICADSEGGSNGSLFIKLDGNGNYISNHKSTSLSNKMTHPTNDRFSYGGFLNSGTFNTQNFVFNKLFLTSRLDCDVTYNHTIEDMIQSISTPDAFQLNPVTGISFSDVTVLKNALTFNQQNYCNNVLSNTINRVENPTISIFPNPVSTALTIESKSPIEKISVYDLRGKLLFEKYKTKQIDVSQLEVGVYFLIIHSSKGQILKKLVKN
ncbi:T9SS type A sorting domain-containing protein [Brumimicrobium mesophilum]|uniref:T9SS type A sorting domain-containing protein n=1 Tax=Brumimicrobium mesophilum TaxID=392717 RepID=UPI000D14339D|nr:T9SS type A sorting domain-containing protein [Brumimicrobium mesophilum]